MQQMYRLGFRQSCSEICHEEQFIRSLLHFQQDIQTVIGLHRAITLRVEEQGVLLPLNSQSSQQIGDSFLCVMHQVWDEIEAMLIRLATHGLLSWVVRFQETR